MLFLFLILPFCTMFSISNMRQTEKKTLQDVNSVPHILERKTLLWWDRFFHALHPVFQRTVGVLEWSLSGKLSFLSAMSLRCQPSWVEHPRWYIKYLTQSLNAFQPNQSKLWATFSYAAQGDGLWKCIWTFWNVRVRIREDWSKKVQDGWTHSHSDFVFWKCCWI